MPDAVAGVVEGPSGGLPLPRNPDDLDGAWLTAALAPGGPARVVGVHSETIGDGKIGSNMRLRLEWSSGRGPASVVAKMPSRDPASRATGVGLGLYVRETRFYQELARDAGARTPDCYVALVDEGSGDFILLLEDLSPAAPGDQLAGCTPAEAGTALAELARLHAAWWERPLPDFVPGSLSMTASDLQPFYSGLVPGFTQKYSQRLAPEVLDVVRRFGDEMDRWGAATSASPLTLVHGDFRLDNLLFSDRRVGVVDWQVVARGPAMSDTSYFLGSGLLPAERRQHEERLLRAYHAAVVSLLAPGHEWRLEDCERDYRLHSLGGLIMAVVASMMVDEGERSNEMFCVMAERHAGHALDCDAFGLLAQMTH